MWKRVHIKAWAGLPPEKRKNACKPSNGANSLGCPTCGKIFSVKSGLTYHTKNRVCERKKSSENQKTTSNASGKRKASESSQKQAKLKKMLRKRLKFLPFTDSAALNLSLEPQKVAQIRESLRLTGPICISLLFFPCLIVILECGCF